MKEKALEEEKLQKKASISVPLVDEHKDDVQLAQKTTFTAQTSLGDRKRKRQVIKSQSVFYGSSSSKKLKTSTLPGHSQAKMMLLKACASKEGRGGEGGSGSLKKLRNSLGVRPRTRAI